MQMANLALRPSRPSPAALLSGHCTPPSPPRLFVSHFLADFDYQSQQVPCSFGQRLSRCRGCNHCLRSAFARRCISQSLVVTLSPRSFVCSRKGRCPSLINIKSLPSASNLAGMVIEHHAYPRPSLRVERVRVGPVWLC